MRRVVALVAMLASGGALACDDANNDVPERLRSAYVQLLGRTDPGAESELADLVKQAPESFCARYQLARHHLGKAEYEEALLLLQDLAAGESVAEYYGEVPFNARGFAKMMLERYEEALNDFTVQLAMEGIETVPGDVLQKVYNNRGYAHLQTDRYEQAIADFEKAKSLGSVLAERNIQVTKSILDTISAGDPNLPGIFAAVVATDRRPAVVDRVRTKLVDAGVAKDDELFVYQRPDGKFSLTVGANESYPKAEARLAKLREHVSDAFISSVAEWRRLDGRPKIELPDVARPITHVLVGSDNTAIGRPDITDAEIRKEYIEKFGWDDVGFHYIVKQNGEITPFRKLAQIPAAAQGRNVGAIAIGLQALEEPRPEMASYAPAQIDSLKYLLETIIARYRIPADQVYSVREFRDLNAGIETRHLRELLAVR